MCGRYALGIRASFVRQQFQDNHMPVADAPEDDDVRQTYNFAPGNHGLVYRADVPDYGAGPTTHSHNHGNEAAVEATEEPPVEGDNPKEIKYKLQGMKWGLVPFWTKRNPDYGSVMKTINARDDSLIENRGMWNTMKQKKRCIVVAQGFYEWLKKNNGKEKIPHYTRRKDGQLMCFAGLWDCVQYEGSDEKIYTYTIITTDSNAKLKFLHDRMPVILENGSDQVRTWLDPDRSVWSKELQSLLKPFDGELDCYPVSKDVGKVGNNSPAFIVPISSAENKNNIANFFGNAKNAANAKIEKKEIKEEEQELSSKGPKIYSNTGDDRATMNQESTEDNAPIPVPKNENGISLKREQEDDENANSQEPVAKAARIESGVPGSDHPQPPKGASKSPEKPTSSRKTRSATSNGTATKVNPAKAGDGSQRITNFFNT